MGTFQVILITITITTDGVSDPVRGHLHEGGHMAGEILRAPYSVDERAALLGWAALQFMRARRGAPV
jgi:hypothetical protein